MVVRRKNGFRSRGRTRRKTGMSTRSMARKALESTDQERKYFNVVFNNQNINDTVTVPTIILLNGMADGTTNTERVGKRIKMESLYMQFAVEKLPADVVENGYVRLMIVYDNQPNGTLPTWTQLLLLPGTGNPVAELLAPNNLNNSQRFRTLFEKRLKFSNGFVEGKLIRKFLSLKGLSPVYNGAGAGVGNMQSGALLLCCCGHITTGGNVPTITGTTRLRFVG